MPTRILVDCGLGIRELSERLLDRGTAVEEIDLLIVTHEHGDHSAGVSRVARAAGCPVVCTHGTRLAMGAAFDGLPSLVPMPAGARFSIFGLEVHLIAVPHDAREPVAVRFSSSDLRMAVVTDLGHVSAHVVNELQSLDALFLEFNHDADMLRVGPYAPRLKARVGGDYGHLSNHQAADLLSRVMSSRMQCVVAAHLSQTNNSVEHVRESVAGLSWGSTVFQIASQGEGVSWVAVQ